MKHLKIYESFFEANIKNFAIDIRHCPDDDKLKILNILEQYRKLRFNGSHNKEDFIYKKDTQGKAWCWTITIDKWNTIYISGVHTPGWYREDLMGHIINFEDFIKLGFEKSIENLKPYPEYDAEYKNMLKNANRYNI